MLGEEHVDTDRSYANLALVYRSNGNEEMLTMCCQKVAQGIFKNVISPATAVIEEEENQGLLILGHDEQAEGVASFVQQRTTEAVRRALQGFSSILTADRTDE